MALFLARYRSKVKTRLLFPGRKSRPLECRIERALELFRPIQLTIRGPIVPGGKRSFSHRASPPLAQNSFQTWLQANLPDWYWIGSMPRKSELISWSSIGKFISLLVFTGYSSRLVSPNQFSQLRILEIVETIFLHRQVLLLFAGKVRNREWKERSKRINSVQRRISCLLAVKEESAESKHVATREREREREGRTAYNLIQMCVEEKLCRVIEPLADAIASIRWKSIKSLLHLYKSIESIL